VRSLTIGESGLYPPVEKDDVDTAQWLELFQLFDSVRTVNVTGTFVPDVVQALGMATEGVLPALTFLTLQEYSKFASMQEAVQLFVNARQRSGRRIFVKG
jgi:hypothetical protein